MAGSYEMVSHDIELIEHMGDAKEAFHQMLWLIISQIGHAEAERLLQAEYYPMVRGEFLKDQSYLVTDLCFDTQYSNEGKANCPHDVCLTCNQQAALEQFMEVRKGPVPTYLLSYQQPIYSAKCSCTHTETQHRLDKTCAECICIGFKEESEIT